MRFITGEAELRRVASELASERLIAVDTEAAGYHRYHDRACLLQVSTRDRTWVVDVLEADGLGGLEPLLERESVEVVLHDADYDLRLLHRDFGVAVRGLFDTRIAAQFVGERAFGLSNLLEKYLDVRLEKKYQRADWARRPLAPDMIEYAALDTRHLPELRDRLRAALESLGRLHWAEEEFRRQEQVRWDPAGNGDAFLRMKGTRDLKPRELAALGELHDWREGHARRLDRAPFRVLGNDALVQTARHMPDSRAALARVPALPRSVAERHGDDLLAAVQRARALPADALPSRPRAPRRPPPDPELEARVDRLKAARDEAAESLGIDRGFLMPRWLLERIAATAPQSAERLRALEDVRDWQVEALGERLLAALRK